MLRRLVVLALIAAVVGFGVFWVVTIPATVPASALAPHTPNLDNGKTMFFAGGCASCHATPGQDDKTRLGGGFGLKSPFGTFYAPNISPDPNDGIGKWSEADFVTAMVKGTSPDGRHYFPGVPVHLLSADRHRRPARPVRVSEDAAGGAGQVEAARRAVSVQHPPHARRLEIPVPRRQAVRRRSRQGRGLESRRLSGQRAGPLRRMSFAAQYPRRHHRKPALRRRARAGRRRLRAEHHAEGLEHVARAGRQAAGDRRDAGRRHCRRRDGQSRRATPAKLSAEDRAAIATYIKSLPPVEGPKPPEPK